MSAASGAVVRRLRAGTRGSKLALIQTELVIERLQAVYPAVEVVTVVITTAPDRNPEVPLARLGDKALFVLDIETALRQGAIDLAVHSLKDVPIAPAEGLTLAAIPDRADVRDVLATRDGRGLDALPAGALVGTSSLRRAGQILARRPDLRTAGIRGNVDTRLRKLRAGDYDAAVLAAAGVLRLGLGDAIAEMFNPDEFVPAPGQGALAVQCRAGSPEAALLAAIDNPAARREIEAERAFAAALRADCRTPVGACARRVAPNRLRLVGEVCDPSGRQVVRVALEGEAAAPAALGEALARLARERGAGALLPGRWEA